MTIGSDAINTHTMTHPDEFVTPNHLPDPIGAPELNAANAAVTFSYAPVHAFG